VLVVYNIEINFTFILFFILFVLVVEANSCMNDITWFETVFSTHYSVIVRNFYDRNVTVCNYDENLYGIGIDRH
jgi:hypothetical protein